MIPSFIRRHPYAYGWSILSLGHLLFATLFMGIAETSVLSSLHYGDGIWLFASDTYAYHKDAIELLAVLKEEGINAWFNHTVISHLHLRSLAYLLFGPDLHSYAPFNAIFWASTAMIIFSAARLMGLPLIGSLGVAGLYSLFPSYLLSSLQPLKDPAYVNGLALIFYAGLSLTLGRATFRSAGYLAIGLFMISLTRPYMFMPLVGIVGIAVVGSTLFRPRHLRQAGEILFGIGVASLLFFGYFTYLPKTTEPTNTPVETDASKNDPCEKQKSDRCYALLATIRLDEKNAEPITLPTIKRGPLSKDQLWAKAVREAGARAYAALRQGVAPLQVEEDYFSTIFEANWERHRYWTSQTCTNRLAQSKRIAEAGDPAIGVIADRFSEACAAIDKALAEERTRFREREEGTRAKDFVLKTNTIVGRFNFDVHTLLKPITDIITFSWTPTLGIPKIVDQMGSKLAYSRYLFLTCCGVGGSTIDYHVNFHQMTDLIAYIPKAAMVGFFAPFPNRWTGSIFQVVAGAEMAVWYGLYGFAAFGLFRPSLPLRTKIFFVCGVAIPLLLLGLAVPNMGAIMRMRYGYLIPVILLAAIEWSERFNAERRRRSTPEET